MDRFTSNSSLFETSNLDILRATLLHSLNTINKIQPADGGHSIVIWNPKIETYDVGATTIPNQPDGAAESRVRRTGGATRWIIDQKQPLIVPNIQDDPFVANKMLQDYGNQAYMGVPLLIEERAIGVLYSLSRESRNYSANEVSLMQDFARFIAITIHNMLLKLEVDQVHKEVVQERNLLQLLIDATPVNIYFKDTKSNYLKTNRSTRKHYGLDTVKEVMGKSDFDFYPENLAAKFHQDDQHVIQTGQALYNKEEINICPDGTERVVLTTKIPLHDLDNTIIGIVGVTRDITDRKIAEQKLRQLNDERQQVAILQKFISDASHDFKTPLSTLKTQLFLLRNDLKDNPARNRLETMNSQVERLINLLEAMLYMSRLDTVEALSLEPIDIITLLRNVISEIRTQADTKQLSIIFDPDDQAVYILGNETELSFVFEELIINAIRNTPPKGHIKVTIDKTSAETVVTIADSGIGIEAEEIPHIFERFYRLDEARGLITGGSGLGLAIVKRIIDLHKGLIQVRSIVGEGSQFTVVIPNE